MSKAAFIAERRPPAPETLVGALQDRLLEAKPVVRAAKSVKVPSETASPAAILAVRARERFRPHVWNPYLFKAKVACENCGATEGDIGPCLGRPGEMREWREDAVANEMERNNGRRRQAVAPRPIPNTINRYSGWGAADYAMRWRG